jgi:hypothetical protein
LQCFACELTWPWQCGHSIFLYFCEGPERLFAKNTPERAGHFAPKDSGQAAIVRLGATETDLSREFECNHGHAENVKDGSIPTATALVRMWVCMPSSPFCPLTCPT